MVSFQPVRFNWLARPSVWEATQNWHARQQEHQANFEASTSLASGAFENAMVSLGIGMAEITAKVAAKRVTSQLQAKITSVNKLA